MDFSNYLCDHFYDEMFDAKGVVRPHYKSVLESFSALSQSDFDRCVSEVDKSFLHKGITFTVYNDDQGTEKIFPFDMIPRIIPKNEWDHIEAGLKQRIYAINLFLKDIYTDQKIIKDGVVPKDYIFSAPHYRKEFVGIRVPKDIYVHICGTDLIRNTEGDYLVLEDNCRCPSTMLTPIWWARKQCSKYAELYAPGVNTAIVGFSTPLGTICFKTLRS